MDNFKKIKRELCNLCPIYDSDPPRYCDKNKRTCDKYQEIAEHLYAVGYRKIDNKQFVEFPKLEKDLGHKGVWTIWSIDEKGDIQCESFETTKEKAQAELKKRIYENEI